MENEKVTIATELNEASNQIDPYCCAILIKSGESVVTVGHISRKISWHCYFFLREEGGEINGNVFCTTYQPSSIRSGGLGIPPPGFEISRSEESKALYIKKRLTNSMQL